MSLTLYLTPGTNINEALLRAVQMLVRASNQGLTDPRSVSMIILVSDGDPTVGKIYSCLHNATENVYMSTLLS